jgi:hypothetical protein
MEDFDIREFAQMFDAALASDNPAVKKALRNFMMVAAIVHAEEQNGEERLMGPLETLVKKVGDLERMVYELQNNRTYKDQYRDYKDYYYNNPTWVYSPNTSTTSGTISGTSFDKVWADEYDTIKDYLKDMKIK